jgi:hypothetical protein
LRPTSSITSRARLAARPVDALHREREGDILEHVQMRQQGEVLEHHAHLVAADFDQLLGRCLEEVPAVEIDLAGGRLDEP